MSLKSFSPDVVATIEMAQTVGWDYIGHDGKGHAQLRHKSGEVRSIAGTTANFRTVENDRHRLWAISGAPAQTKRAGKYRKGVSSRRNEPRHIASAAEVEASRERNDLTRQHDRLLTQLKTAHAEPATCDRDLIGRAVRDLLDIRGQMEALGHDVPPLPFRL